MTPEQWAARWPQAAAELRALVLPETPTLADGRSETHAQSLIRLRAPYNDAILWRNNRGALKDARGVPVRYGLLNDTPELNKKIKSADLIGMERTLITQAMVGTYKGIFLSVECKKTGWQFEGGEHEGPQLTWAQLVTAWGGRAVFATGPSDVW